MNGEALARFAPREGAASDEIVGVRPKLVFAPEKSEDAAALMAELAAQRLVVAFVGGGTQVGLGAPPERLDAVISTRRLNQIVEYAPSDQIVVAQAGITLSALQQKLAEAGQRLALDPPWPDRATLGGIVASNAFGPLRTRYGSIRDLIIGIHFIRADGVAARGGGKVVKNVAGFDLPKLLVGSLGTLGLITTVTCRLHPLPEKQVTLLMPNRTAASVRALVAQIRAAQLEPAAVVALREGTGFAVSVRFEGFQAGVEDQKERLISLVSPQGPCSALDEAGARDFAARHDRVRVGGTLRTKIAALPGSLDTVVPECVVPLCESLEHAGFVSYPTLGIGFVSGDVNTVARASEAIATARGALARLGGSLVLEEAPAEVRARCDVWGQTKSALSLMRSVKARLDPEHRMAPGRFVGGN